MFIGNNENNINRNPKRNNLLVSIIIILMALGLYYLYSCCWTKCKATGKISLASVSIQNGKLYRNIDIFKPSFEIINDENPPIFSMIMRLSAISFDSDFKKDLELISSKFTNIKSIDIGYNTSVNSINKTNVLAVSFMDNNPEIAKQAVNTLMKATIASDIEIAKSAITRNRNQELFAEIPIMLKEKQSFANDKVYWELTEQYISQLPEENETSSINFEIVELAKPTCSVIGYFNWKKVYLQIYQAYLFFQYF